MTKFDYLDKYYQRFINDIAKNSSHKSVTVIVLNGAKGANLNLVLNDFSKIGKIHQVSKSTAITESKKIGSFYATFKTLVLMSAKFYSAKASADFGCLA